MLLSLFLIGLISLIGWVAGWPLLYWVTALFMILWWTKFWVEGYSKTLSWIFMAAAIFTLMVKILALPWWAFCIALIAMSAINGGEPKVGVSVDYQNDGFPPVLISDRHTIKVGIAGKKDHFSVLMSSADDYVDNSGNKRSIVRVIALQPIDVKAFAASLPIANLLYLDKNSLAGAEFELHVMAATSLGDFQTICLALSDL